MKSKIGLKIVGTLLGLGGIAYIVGCSALYHNRIRPLENEFVSTANQLNNHGNLNIDSNEGPLNDIKDKRDEVLEGIAINLANWRAYEGSQKGVIGVEIESEFYPLPWRLFNVFRTAYSDSNPQ